MIGYVFGFSRRGIFMEECSMLTFGKWEDGNAGSTNALRTLGIKAGICTFLGDSFKCIFAVLAVRLIFGGTYEEILPPSFHLCRNGGGTRHNFPFYLKYKGGKALRLWRAFCSAYESWITLIALVVFVTIVAVTKYVSVGSIAVVLIFLCGCRLPRTDRKLRYGLRHISMRCMWWPDFWRFWQSGSTERIFRD